MKNNFSKPFAALTLLLSLIVLSFSVQAQVTFQKSYDLGSDDYLNMSTFNTAGEIISAGSSNYTGAGGYDAILTKFDGTGVFMWEKQYGGTGTEFGTALAATTSGSGFVVAGRSNSFTGSSSLDIALIKADNNGDLQWSKTYGTDSTEHALFVTATSDNGFIVTGQTRSLGNGGLDLFLLKTDSTGEVEWFNTYGTIGNEAGYHVVEDPSGGYIAVGYSGFGGSGLNDAYLVKTDAAGNIDGQLLIGGTGDDAARRILITNNGIGILTGITRPTVSNSQDDIFVVAIDFANNLTLLWSKTFGNSAGNDAPTSVVPFPDGSGYAFSGNSGSFGAPSGLLFLVDTNGVYQGGINYQGPGDVFLQDLVFGNTGAVLTGFGNGFGGTSSDLYLIGFPGDPQQTCLRQDITLEDATFNVTILGPVIATHLAVPISASAVAVSFTQSSASAAESDVCANLPLAAAAGNDGSVCAGGGSFMLGGNPPASGGTAPYTYLWSPSTGLDNPTNPYPNATPGSNTTYTLTVTDSLGATATDEVTLVVDSLPNADINPPGPNICAGQNVTLTASGGISYLWSTGDTTAVIVQFPTATSTTYTVTVTNNCGTATATETVNSFTRPTVTVTPNNPTICDTSSTGVTLHATGAETYTWTPSTGLSSDTSSNPVALPTSTTTYTVTGKNGHCAGNNPTTVTVTVDVCIGIKDIPHSIASIFPNPAKDRVNLTFDSQSSSVAVVSIVAVNGKIELESKVAITYGLNNLSINTERLAPGLYFIKLKWSETTAIAKVIIE